MPIIIDKTTLSKDLISFTNLVRKRLRQDWDLVISITGEEGCGKSTLAMLVAGLIDPRFDFQKNVSMLPNEKEVREEFSALKRYQCYVIDEAIRALYKMNFMSGLQQMLVQMWATERFQNKATILILPRFKDLTENFRNHRVKIWIHVLARGHAVVYLRDDDPHTMDPWQFDYMSKYKFKKFVRRNIATIPLEERLKLERKMRNYLFDFEFPDLDPIDKAKYNELKQLSRIEFADKQQEDEKNAEGKLATRYRTERNWLVWNWYEKLSKHNKIEIMETICEKCSLSKATFKKIIKEGNEVEQEQIDKEERINTYVGVDRFLDQALKLEKSKQLPENKVKKDWRIISS